MTAATVTPATVRAVFAREEGCCARCGKTITGERGRDWSVHHRRPRGSGGSSLTWVNLAGNLLVLCGSGVTGCHGWVESNRERALANGYLVRATSRWIPADLPVLHSLYGWCLLKDDGMVGRINPMLALELLDAAGSLSRDTVQR